MKLRGDIRETGLRIHGLRSTGLIEELRRDGQAGRMVDLQENSKGRLIQRRAFTRQTA